MGTILTKDMVVGEVIQLHPEVQSVLEAHGMCCGSCMGAHEETIEVSARMHGVDANRLLAELNQLLSAEP
jgi:hybrid cluster-associated redox disulfide protein